MQRILITGGAGFIGTHLIKRLKRDCAVYVIDNLSNEKSIENMNNNKTPLLHSLKKISEIKRRLAK